MPMPKDLGVRRGLLSDLDANLLVEAGAGSGKTSCLSSRMLRLIAREQGDLQRVAAITFTRKAASEMRQRVQEGLEAAVSKGAWLNAEQELEAVPEAWLPGLERALSQLERLRISTVHSFCTRLLQSYPLEAGVDPDFITLEEDEELAALEQGLRLHLAESEEDGGLVSRLDAWKPEQGFVAYCRGYEPDLRLVAADAGLFKSGPGRQMLAAAFKGLQALLALAEEGERFPLKPGKEDAYHDLCHSLARAPLGPEDPQGLGWALHRLLKSYEKAVAKQGPGQELKPADLGIGVNSYAKQALGRALFSQAEAVILQQGLLGFLEHWRAWRHACLAQVFERAEASSRRRRLSQGRLTFSDLVRTTLQLLEQPGVLDRMRQEVACLLVDEFQDTDPLQLRLAFALAAEPGTPIQDPGFWRQARLRPGSLFLVGDPKQSIYRFRRADIQLYLQVRQLAEQALPGGLRLKELSANFRSLEAIIAPVNQVFGSRLLASPYQASYAPMQAMAQAQDGPAGFYLLAPRPMARSVGADAGEDARQVALAIQGLCGQGFKPGDMLVLTGKKARLGAYVRALELLGIPVDVSGAENLGDYEEMADLARLLRLLAQPDDSAALAGVLRGAWFGLRDQDLVDHVKATGHGLSLWQGRDAGGPVAEALRTLHAWRASLQGLPALGQMAWLLQQGGLFLQASLGPSERSLRLGNLWRQLEAFASRQAQGEPLSLMAMARELGRLSLEPAGFGGDAKKAEGGQARPGAADAVRLMNLHKAKGLEARFVFLANPVSGKDNNQESGQQRAICRGREGQDLLFLSLGQDCLPLGWAGAQEAAREAEQAERLRLLYVAATRAKQACFISQATGVKGNVECAWQQLEDLAQGRVWGLPAQTAAPVASPAVDGPQLKALVQARLAASQQPGYLDAAVSSAALELGLAGRPVAVLKLDALVTHAGSDFGTAMHACFERMVRLARAGAPLTDQALQGIALKQAMESGLEMEAHQDLMLLCNSLRNSALWGRILGAEECWAEYEAMLPHPQGPGTLTAQIDLALKEPDGWVLLDWKSDRDQRGLEHHQAQLSAYAHAFEQSGAGTVKECVLVFGRG